MAERYDLMIYVAGPFRGEHPWAVEQNVRNAENLAFRVWEAGASALCPHTNTRFFDKSLPDKAFLDGTLTMLKACQAIILTENWKTSRGATAEREWAINNGLPVFYSIEELEAWLETAPPHAPEPSAWRAE